MSELTAERRARPSDSYRWQKQRRMELQRGLKRTTDASRAQAHVQSLVASHGVSLRSIGEACGISYTTISHLNRGLCTKLLVVTEKAILGVRVENIFERPNPRGSVPMIGTRRRIQALLAIGWRHQDLTPLLGFTSHNMVHQAGEWVTRRNHDAVKAVYDRLWNQRGPAPAQSMGRIARAGYAPPLAWDDDTIDDPNATPDLGAKVYAQGRSPEGAVRYSDAIVENTEFLVRSGIGWAAIPERLGSTAYAIERALHRAGRSDLVARAKTFEERREYVRAS